MSDNLEEAVLDRLHSVIDPETNTDVVRMRLVENLWADALGKVRYTFRHRNWTHKRRRSKRIAHLTERISP